MNCDTCNSNNNNELLVIYPNMYDPILDALGHFDNMEQEKTYLCKDCYIALLYKTMNILKVKNDNN